MNRKTGDAQKRMKPRRSLSDALASHQARVEHRKRVMEAADRALEIVTSHVERGVLPKGVPAEVLAAGLCGIAGVLGSAPSVEVSEELLARHAVKLAAKLAAKDGPVDSSPGSSLVDELLRSNREILCSNREDA